MLEGRVGGGDLELTASSSSLSSQAPFLSVCLLPALAALSMRIDQKLVEEQLT